MKLLAKNKNFDIFSYLIINGKSKHDNNNNSVFNFSFKKFLLVKNDSYVICHSSNQQFDKVVTKCPTPVPIVSFLPTFG